MLQSVTKPPLPGRLYQIVYLALTPLVLAALWLGLWSFSYWLYALPLIAFAIFPGAIAAGLLAIILPAAVIITQWHVLLPDRHQMLAALSLATLLAMILVFMREYKSRQLLPLRRTDELTQAASREFLSADLHKEIQRSEREGSNLSVAILGLDGAPGEAVPEEDILAILPRIGHYLHGKLRDFDTYYRTGNLEFLIILPGMNTAEATQTISALRPGLDQLMTNQGLNMTSCSGVAGLNIGDDAESLQQNAVKALRRAQQKNGDRSQPLSHDAHPDNGSTGARP
ncbi:MAG: hypothetical protein AWU57_687 [Marinobacter sp. T13-3]|nr:MAG: hypothetical protein AWU57_687 [Marinobacter sp. T13-3]